MSYYNKNLTKSSWNFIDPVEQGDQKLEMLKERAGELNNVLFNETQKSKIVESCILKCNAKVDLFSKENALADPCLNSCMYKSLEIMKSVDFINNYHKY